MSLHLKLLLSKLHQAQILNPSQKRLVSILQDVYVDPLVIDHQAYQMLVIHVTQIQSSKLLGRSQSFGIFMRRTPLNQVC